MVSKIRIKLGPLEVEYEGDEVFFKEELPQILSEISRMVKETGIGISAEPTILSSTEEKSPPSGRGLQGTITTFASKLQPKGGPELILAAAAKLTFNDGLPIFTRDQLNDEMKNASGYYKQSYSKNLISNLTSLIKSGKLIENSKGRYSLDARLKSDLESRLAN
jgi:hypothetical protein